MFATFCGPSLYYHNLDHTEKVVANAGVIAATEHLTDFSEGALLVACWFHDVGHLFGQPEGHEQRSIDYFRVFAKENQLPREFTNIAVGCIEATRMPHHPVGILQEIICDADTFNLGTREFVDTDRRLRREMQERKGLELQDWDVKTYQLLLEQRFFTKYCQEVLSQGLEANRNLVWKRISLG